MSNSSAGSSGSGRYSNENENLQQSYMGSYDSGGQMMEGSQSDVGSNMGYSQGYMNAQQDPSQQPQHPYMGYDPSNTFQYPSTPTSSTPSGGGLPPASSLFSSSGYPTNYDMSRGPSSAPPMHSTSNVYLQNQPHYGSSSSQGQQGGPLPPLSSFAQPQGPPGYPGQHQPPRTPMSAPPQHPQPSPSMPPPQSPFLGPQGGPQSFPSMGEQTTPSMNPPGSMESRQNTSPEFRPPSAAASGMPPGYPAPGSTMSAPPQSPTMNRPPSAKAHQTHHGQSVGYPQGPQGHQGPPGGYPQAPPQGYEGYMQPQMTPMPMDQQQGQPGQGQEGVMVQNTPQANVYIQHLPARPPSGQNPAMSTDQQGYPGGPGGPGQDQGLKAPKNPPRYRNPGSYSPRGAASASNRNKATPISSMLPSLRAPIPGLSAGDDGPTVRQHLQQQQAAQRQRIQQEMMQKRMEEDRMKQGPGQGGQGPMMMPVQPPGGATMQQMIVQGPDGQPVTQQPQHVQQIPGNIQMTYVPQTAYIQVISTENTLQQAPMQQQPTTMTMVMEPQKPTPAPPQATGTPPKKAPPKRQRPSRAKNAQNQAPSAIITTMPTEPGAEPQQTVLPPPKSTSKKRSAQAKKEAAQAVAEAEAQQAGSPSKQAKMDAGQQGQTQCRIVHFQKPPAEAEFPQTETTIHVVQAPPPYSIQVQGQGQGPLQVQGQVPHGQQQMHIYQPQVQPGQMIQQGGQQYFIVEQFQTPQGHMAQRVVPTSPSKQAQIQQGPVQAYPQGGGAGQGPPQVAGQGQQQVFVTQDGQMQQGQVMRIQQGNVISVQQFPSVAQIQQQNDGSGFQVQESGQVVSTIPTSVASDELQGQTQPQAQGQPFDRPQQHFIIQASSNAVDPSRVLTNVSSADGVTTTVYSTMPQQPQAHGAPAPGQRPQLVRTTPAQGGAIMVAANGTAPLAATPVQATRNGTASRPSSGARAKVNEEESKYGMKEYYLKRTIKSLCFKNAALCDEVARLHERIATVTEERKLIAKRLQHYERNRIRRLQTQQRKADAAAAALKTGAPPPTSAKRASVSSKISVASLSTMLPMSAPVVSMAMPNFNFPMEYKPNLATLTSMNMQPKQEVFSPNSSIGQQDMDLSSLTSPMTLSMQPPESLGLSVITSPTQIGTMTTPLGSNNQPSSHPSSKVSPSPRSTRASSQASERASQEPKQGLNVEVDDPSPNSIQQKELRERRGSANRSLTNQAPMTKPSPGTRSSARQQEIQQKRLQDNHGQAHQLRARSKSSVSPSIKLDKPLEITTTRSLEEEGQGSDKKESPVSLLTPTGADDNKLVSPRPKSGRKAKTSIKKETESEGEASHLLDEMTPEPESSEGSADTSKSNTPSGAARRHSTTATPQANRVRQQPPRELRKRKA